MSYSAPNPIGYPPAVGCLAGWWTCIPQRVEGSSGAWPSANLAIYVPVVISRTVVVFKLGVENGAAVSGNFDAGIYDAAGVRLVSTGSTAQSGTSSEQIVDVTDTTLPPGIYYWALCLDNATGAVFRLSPSAPGALAFGVLTEALGSVTLPATATFSANQTLAYIPHILAFVEGTAT